MGICNNCLTNIPNPYTYRGVAKRNCNGHYNLAPVVGFIYVFNYFQKKCSRKALLYKILFIYLPTLNYTVDLIN